ncbi:MAG: HDOD domain-containing protein, partial [Planctomycetaceae bacterium]|nr:HDOD domain-containing protein [Planctomycetaceae bacterium]
MESPNWTEIRQAKLADLHGSVLPPDLKLPILPQALTEFSEKAADPNVNPKILGQIVERDAGLTCELLRNINSAATGLRCQVSSVTQAINLLGIRNTGLLLATTAVKSAMSARSSKLINLQIFWNTNFERALFARDMARTMKVDEELAFAGAMLQDFLLPVLTNELVDCYVNFASQDRKDGLTLSQFEHAEWGWDHALATGQLMVDWKFPDDLVCCVLYHHNGLDVLSNPQIGRSAVAAVAIAGLLPDFFHQVPQGLDRLIKLDTAWPAFQLAERLQRVADELLKSDRTGGA